MKYPYAKHFISKNNIEAVVNVLENKSLTQGDSVVKFEKDLANFLDCKEVIVCSSGTAALHLIYLAMGLSKNSAILTTPITFLATAHAARYLDANVYFADVEPDSGLICKESVYNILKKLKDKIKVLVLVHLGSKVCDLEYFKKIAKEFNIFLVEDSCHSLGEKYISKNNKVSMVGSAKYSDAAAFSFHAIKNITTGEGGAIATNNKKLAEKIKLFRSHGSIRDKKWKDTLGRGPWYYESKLLGFNYRLTDFQAALGSSQLKVLKKQNKHKEIIAHKYISLLKDCKYICLPKLKHKKFNQAWHLFSININFKKIKKNKNEIMRELEKKGIGTQIHYIPIYKQPIYKNTSSKILKGAEGYYKSTLSLPIYPTLTEKDVEYIVHNLKKILYG